MQIREAVQMGIMQAESEIPKMTGFETIRMKELGIIKITASEILGIQEMEMM